MKNKAIYKYNIEVNGITYEDGYKIGNTLYAIKRVPIKKLKTGDKVLIENGMKKECIGTVIYIDLETCTVDIDLPISEDCPSSGTYINCEEFYLKVIDEEKVESKTNTTTLKGTYNAMFSIKLNGEYVNWESLNESTKETILENIRKGETWGEFEYKMEVL